ncbi:MAG: hypothetical protein S4CHLAM6_10680 [Chlamydiae bacterium]|nr:hypothetical protein [Chlamydiota bacterium]
MGLAVNPPPYNPHYISPEPSAPPAPQAYETAEYYEGISQAQIGHDMLKAEIATKTDWVPNASVPQDSTLQRILRFTFSIFSPTRQLEKAECFLQAGKMFYATIVNDHKEIEACNKLRKSNAAFAEFLSELESNKTNNANDCLISAIELGAGPEAYFLLGKYNFVKQDYTQATRDFFEASELSDKLPGSSSFKKKCFKALSGACAAASSERNELHDDALHLYIQSSKIDPYGPTTYAEPISRNFQILKFRSNKTESELRACIEYDPNDPDFQIDLCSNLAHQGQYDEAMHLLTESFDKAYNYKPSSLYHCAEVAHQVAFAINNAPKAHLHH